MIDEVAQTLVWPEVLALSDAMVRVCEQFTQDSDNVLVKNISLSVVAVPTSIAEDLLQHRAATMSPLIKLATELALVRKIYPAIDVDEAMECLDSIHQRIMDGKFAERRPTPGPEPLIRNDEDGGLEHGSLSQAASVETPGSPAEHQEG